MGKLDNTLIIYISGDNGASAEAAERHAEEMLSSRHRALGRGADEFYDAWAASTRTPLRSAVDLGVRYALQWTEQIPSSSAARATAWRFHGRRGSGTITHFLRVTSRSVAKAQRIDDRTKHPHWLELLASQGFNSLS